jgi:multiple sugar transport system substrate-binding protein
MEEVASMVKLSRRRFLAGGLGVAGIAVLTACSQQGGGQQAGGGQVSGGSQPAQQGAAKASSKENVTLRLLTTESDPPSRAVYDAALAEFSQANPNIKVEVEYISHDARTEKIVTGVGAKRAPQITQLVAYEVAEYGRLGFLSPMDDLIQETGGPDKWQPGSLTATKGTDGKTYALPYAGSSTRTLWHRKDMLDKAGLQPPKTWDEWKKTAETLTKDTNGDGALDEFGVTLPGGKNRWTMSNYMLFLWQTGETVFDKDFNVIFGKDGAVKAMEFYRDMVKFGPPAFASYSYTESIDAFVSGKAMTQLYSGRPLGRVNDSRPDLVPVTRGAKLPAGPIGGEVGPVTWDTYAIFNEKVGVSPAEQQAGKLVLKHLLTGKAATDFALTVPGHLLPPYLDTLKDPHLWDGHPLMKSHKAEVEWLYTTTNGLDYITEAGATITAEKVTPGNVNPYWPAIDSSMVIPTMVQKVLVQNEAPKSAIEWGVTEMKRLVDEAKAKQKR